MGTYKFTISGVLDSNLSAEQLESQLAVCLCDVDNNEKTTIDGESDKLRVAHYDNDLEIIEVCGECGKELEYKMIDVDGTNLEERLVCPQCEEY